MYNFTKYRGKAIMKKFFAGVIIFLLLVNVVTAESIDGPANIREKPNGKIIFSLNNEAIIGCDGVAQNNWYLIAITVFIRQSSFTSDQRINSDQTLYNKNGEEIGKTLTVILPLEWESITYHKEINFYSCVLAGYTHINNINPNSVLERLLENGLEESKETISINNYKELLPIEKYGYSYSGVNNLHDIESGLADKGFSHSSIYEFSTGPISMGIRVMLIFQYEKLVALIYTKRDINYNFYKQKLLKKGWTYRIGYIQNVKADIQKNLEEQYTFFLGHID